MTMVALARYIEALTDLGHLVTNHLRLGLPCSVVERFEQELGIQLPQDIKELFMVYDGTDFQKGVLLGHGQLIVGFHLMALSEVRSAKEDIDEIIEDYPLLAGKEHAFVGRNMLPILADYLGNHIVVDVSRGSKRFGWIGTFEHADESQTDVFASFYKLIEAHLEALKYGAYKINDEGYIEANYEKLQKILSKHQNRSSF